MSTFVTDAKFSNIELTSTSDLIYIDSTPLLRNISNGQYKLNVSNIGILGGIDVIEPQQPMSRLRKQRKKYFRHDTYDSTELYFGDMDGDTNVNAIDALRVLRIQKSLDSIEVYSDIGGADRKVLSLAFSKPESYTGNLPGIGDVFEILRISAGLVNKTVYIPIAPTPTPTVYTYYKNSIGGYNLESQACPNIVSSAYGELYSTHSTLAAAAAVGETFYTDSALTNPFFMSNGWVGVGTTNGADPDYKIFQNGTTVGTSGTCA